MSMRTDWKYEDKQTTGGDMSHKILVELEPENEAELRAIADHYKESMSVVASRILNSHFEQFRIRARFYAIDRSRRENDRSRKRKKFN